VQVAISDDSLDYKKKQSKLITEISKKHKI